MNYDQRVRVSVNESKTIVRTHTTIISPYFLIVYDILLISTHLLISGRRLGQAGGDVKLFREKQARVA